MHMQQCVFVIGSNNIQDGGVQDREQDDTHDLVRDDMQGCMRWYKERCTR